MKPILRILALSVISVTSLAANRLIQIRSVDFTTNVMELHNFDSSAQDLSGWRFCSHDENQVRLYSSSSGLNGLTIQPGESLFIHFDGDAPAGDSSAINSSAIGSFATPLDRGPYGIQLYNGGSFGNGANIIDHLQWSIDGVDDVTADDRSDEAQSGGTWTDQNLWIATTAASELLTLTDTTGAGLHSPANYQVSEPVAFPETLAILDCTVSATGEVTLNWEDLSAFGSIEYLVEILGYDPQQGFQVFSSIPTTATTVTLSDFSGDSLFFRVNAVLAPQ